MSTAAVPSSAAPKIKTPVAAEGRLLSIDVYRGFTMIMMASDAICLPITAALVLQQPDASPFWKKVLYHTDHAEWLGCGLWEFIQPSFMYLVGVALAFSGAKRLAQGQSFGRMFLHALWRGLVLVLLGIFLRSKHLNHTFFTFEDVLTQIGLGYPFLFLLWNRPRWLQWTAAIAILVGYWGLFAAYPLPPEDFDRASVKAADVEPLTGFAAHWNKNTNPAHAFDVWFLNLFPPQEPEPWFTANPGGYQTLNFVPSLATMIFGLLTGELLRSLIPQMRKVMWMVVFGLAGVVLGWVMDVDLLGICPIVKRIWTPSWTLYAAGCTTLAMAAFYLVVDVWQFRRWTFPFVVVGVNSMLFYLMHYFMFGWLMWRLHAHFGKDLFTGYGTLTPYEPTITGSVALLIMWLINYWFYKNRAILKI